MVEDREMVEMNFWRKYRRKRLIDKAKNEEIKKKAMNINEPVAERIVNKKLR